MKNFATALAVFLMSIFMIACDPTTMATGAQIGSKLVVSIIEARQKYPDDFEKQAQFYAGLYCDMRDEYGFQWVHVRSLVAEHGIPDWMINATKVKIDRECGE